MADQRARIERIEAAIEARAFDRAREVLLREGALIEWEDHRVGLTAILDCLSEPGAESERRGRSFVATYRASPLRRRVRRACLGDPTINSLPPRLRAASNE